MPKKAEDNFVTLYSHNSKVGITNTMLYSHNQIMNNDSIIVKWDSEKITIKIPEMDYRGGAYTPRAPNKRPSGKTVMIITDTLPFGKFLIDEDESNEDQVVVYFEDQING